MLGGADEGGGKWFSDPSLSAGDQYIASLSPGLGRTVIYPWALEERPLTPGSKVLHADCYSKDTVNKRDTFHCTKDKEIFVSLENCLSIHLDASPPIPD